MENSPEDSKQEQRLIKSKELFRVSILMGLFVNVILWFNVSLKQHFEYFGYGDTSQCPAFNTAEPFVFIVIIMLSAYAITTGYSLRKTRHITIFVTTLALTLFFICSSILSSIFLLSSLPILISQKINCQEQNYIFDMAETELQQRYQQFH